jgi:cephalosporin hydroxylase
MTDQNRSRKVGTTMKNYLMREVKRKLKQIVRRRRWDERVRFNTETIYNGHFQVTYRGVATIKCPFDFVLYQMIVGEVKPDLIIEIGTNKGGSALYLGDLLETIGHGIVHTIDIENCSDILLSDHHRIKLFHEGFEGYDISRTDVFEKILVIDDGSHLYEHVYGSLRKFSPVVSKDSYFVVEDGIVDKLGMSRGFHGGPLRAIREFMAEENDFIIDRKWCDFFGRNATFNVNGYLKKVK